MQRDVNGTIVMPAEDDILAQYKRIKPHIGSSKVHFIRGATFQIIAEELKHPTVFENKCADYYISSCLNVNNKKRKIALLPTYQAKNKKHKRCPHNRRKSRCKECGGASICPHNRRKSRCKECGGASICLHNRIKSVCKECGGSEICLHNRRKSQCKECGGSEICPHNRIKSKCKECGGASICPHNRRKSRCKECGGASICPHNRQKSQCKECGGASICPHNRQKSKCKECEGASICLHKREKSKCKECGGSRICPHNRVISTCKECGGSSICSHNRVKSTCKECGGSSICPHNRVKYECKECGGGSICSHNRRKSYCKECGGSALCVTPLCEVYKNRRYKPYCFRCFMFNNPNAKQVRNYKTKELAVREFIVNEFPTYPWEHDKKITEGCSLRRPDLFVDLMTHVIFIECDEGQHEDYSCENKRMMELSQDVAHRPAVFIRFNPDNYITEQGLKIKSCWKRDKHGLTVLADPLAWKLRLQVLKNCVIGYLQTIPQKTLTIEQLFFSF